MRVLVHYDHPELFTDLLTSRFPDVSLECCQSYAELEGVLNNFQPDVLFAIKFENRPYPREPVLACPSLKWISVGGAGVDHIAPWDPNVVTVTNGSGVASGVMAQYVMGALIALNMRFPKYWRQQADHVWDWGYVESLEGKTLTIVGLGNIGREIARLAGAMGLRVVGTRAHPAPTEGVDKVYGNEDLHSALADGDFVVISAPLLTSTRHMIDASAFAAMKDGVGLVDVSRGGVVDSQALIAAMEAGKLSGAVLDVFEQEPMPDDCPLWDRDNVLITPHCSSVFRGWERKTFAWFCDNLERYQAGKSLQNIVDPAKGY